MRELGIKAVGRCLHLMEAGKVGKGWNYINGAGFDQYGFPFFRNEGID